MYDIKTIKKTLKLLEKLDFKIKKTAQLTGIKERTITSWRQKQKNGEPLLIRPFVHTNKGKWSDEERRKVCDYYFEHGQSLAATIRKFGYPARSTLRGWLQNDKRYKKKDRIMLKNAKIYSTEDKIDIVKLYCSRDGSGENALKNLGVTRSTVCNWYRELTGENMKKQTSKSKEVLLNDIEKLRKEHAELELENKILKKANEVLKKEIGVNYDNLTNKEKTIVVNALKTKHKIVDLLKIINLKKSTYNYEKNHINVDKYNDIRKIIVEIFNTNYRCYGYRRIKAALKLQYKINISEKVIRRLMKEENLRVYKKKKAKFSSYAGEISSEVPNLLNRNFKADKPFEKLLTDITEFALKDGKVYLSPLIDCYDGKPITYTIGKSPNMELTNTMLIRAHEKIKDRKCIIHNDRGFHYRIKSWIDLMEGFGYIRSMSKKGCTPDNSMCEGFFGTIKNEFFYPNDWRNTTCDEFIPLLDNFLQRFTKDRIKIRLIEKV